MSGVSLYLDGVPKKSFQLINGVLRANPQSFTIRRIIIYYRCEDGKFFKSTKQQINECDWIESDPKRKLIQRVEPKITGASNINFVLDELSSKLNRVIREKESNGLPIYKKYLEDLFIDEQKPIESKVNEEVPEKTLWEIWDEFLKLSKTNISKIKDKPLSDGTIKNYKKVKNRVKLFSDKHWPDLNINDFKNRAPEFEIKFREFMLEELKVVPLTFGDYIKNLKVFLKWCRKKSGYKVGKKYKQFYRPRRPGRAKALKKEELLALYDLNLSSDHLLERELLIFLFLCSSAMRQSDYNQFAEDPFKYIEEMVINGDKVKYINLGAIKNDQECIVPYFDDLYFRPVWLVETMLKKYGSLPKIKDNTMFNKRLKEIFALAGITRQEIEPSSKLGRKVWSSVKRKLGMNKDMIRKVTGHRDDKSLEHYIGIDPQDILQDAVATAVYLKAG
jgi:hypothetical protein